MRGGCGRLFFIAALGASGGAVAALAGYAVRSPERRDIFDFKTNVRVSDLTLSTQPWSIVGLTLLGALVCGLIAAASVSARNRTRVLMAFFIAAPLGALLCWGARWLMDCFIWAAVGGAKTIDAVDALRITAGPWFIWQVAVALGLTIPVVLAIGPSKFTIMRGLIGTGLIIFLSLTVSGIVDAALVAILFGSAIAGAGKGGPGLDIAQLSDVVYLFTMGLSTGIAFAIAEVVYKPAWLVGRGGRLEGRKWTLASAVSRIGCTEGLEVYIPHDGTVAPIHAQIQGQDESHFITDLVGATTVNGALIQSCWLRDGDVLGVGQNQLTFKTRLARDPISQPVAVPTPVPTARAVQVVVVDPIGNRYPLKTGSNTIGREASCDIALTWEQGVSRQHCRLDWDGQGTLILSDLGSTNGTHVAGMPISGSQPINVNSEFLVGKVVMKVLVAE